MFQKLASSIQYPDWVRNCPRYRTLDLYDRLLDGTFYDHLRHAFYDEIQGQDKPIPLIERRPSARFNLPRWVARQSARRLWAGRHSPLVRHKDKAQAKLARALVRRSRLWRYMLEATYRGVVGSCAMTFRVTKAEGKPPVVSLSLWRAKFCDPIFDEQNELTALRLRFLTTAAAAKAFDPSADVIAGQTYWFIRDYRADAEVTYKPVKQADWDPVTGFKTEGMSLEPWDGHVFEHKLGTVPAQWFVNLTGGDAPDGACTFADAIPNSIELDYTLSQIGRGVRYNAAPQLVIKGMLLNGDQITRGPMAYLHVDAGAKDEAGGESRGAGDAKLLEMSGSGTDAALKLIAELRQLALEQIAASRKDPEKMKGPLSGRAMEFLDEDNDDLVMELRTQWGDEGALPLLRKIAIAQAQMGGDKIDAAGLSLQWPRLFQPTADDLGALIPALIQAVTPIAAPQPPAAAGGEDGKPAPKPAAAAGAGDTLLTIEQARAYLESNMDLSMLDMRSDDGDEDDDGPVGESSTAPEPIEDATRSADKVGEFWNINKPVQV
jgi:hypothetical protein